MQLLRFHLVEDESCEKEIKQGLEKKLDRMVIHICNRKQGFIRRSILFASIALTVSRLIWRAAVNDA